MTFSLPSTNHDRDNSCHSIIKPRIGRFSRRWKKITSIIHQAGSLKSMVRHKKRSSPHKCRINDTRATVSNPLHITLPCQHPDASTSQIFSNMFIAYRLNHRAHKSSRYTLKNLSEQLYYRYESKVQEEINTHSPISAIRCTLNDNTDLESLALSSVSSMTLSEAGHHNNFCHNTDSLLGWIVDSVSCLDYKENILSSSVSSKPDSVFSYGEIYERNL